MSKPTIFGVNLSPFVRKTILFATEANIDFDYEMTRPHADNPAFQAASPLGKIPAMVDGDVRAADSTVIIHHLSRTNNSALIPTDGQAFVDTLWWEEYADTVMTSAIVGHLYAEVIMAERFFNRAPIESDIELARTKEIPAICGFIESRLNSDFLVGNEVTLADVAVGAALIAMHHCGDTIDAAAYPKVAAWWDRLASRASFKAIIQQDAAIMKQLGYDSPLAV